MGRQRSAKDHSDSGPTARSAAVATERDVVELKGLIADIVLRLSRLSHTQGEIMSFHFQHRFSRPRSYRSPARVEAEALYHMVQAGRDTIENVRDLISVPAQMEEQVKDLNYPNPGDQKRLLATLKFRKQVLVEFESLVEGERSPELAVVAGSREH